MIKSLKQSFLNERNAFSVPKSTQKSIPIKRIFKDGIWLCGNGKFTKCWRFSDINYSVASYDDQMEMFLAWCNTLNAFSTDATYKVTIHNHRLDRKEFSRTLLMETQGDNLDNYRGEYNKMLLEKAGDSNGLIQEKYITVSVSKKTIEEARTFFARIDNDLTANFSKLSSALKPLDNSERLHIFHDFYRIGII